MNQMRNFLNILSVVVLFAGVIAGVVLVQNEQDIRRSAAPEDKVKICHKTGNGDEFNQIEVAEQAVQSHLDHGDKLSGCDSTSPEQSAGGAQPEPASQQGGQVQVQENQPIQTETPQNTTQPTQEQVSEQTSSPQAARESSAPSSNQNTNSNTTSNNNNTANSVSITNTFISPLNKNIFNFQFRLQGITKSGVTRNVTLTFTKSGNQSVRNLTAVSSEGGLFEGSISGLEVGEYEVLVKPDPYLANRFKNVNVTSGTTDWNWTTSTFRVGDFNNDNVINLLDIGMILAIYNQKSVSVNSSNRQYDVNASNLIDEVDIDIVLGNYTSLNVTGEK